MGEKAKVYFTDFRTKVDVPLTAKLQKLIRKAGIGSIDMGGKFVAIKMHFGELGNLAFLRPNYAKAVADVVKENGGMPFLTDCNTLYPGSRKNALEHLTCAEPEWLQFHHNRLSRHHRRRTARDRRGGGADPERRVSEDGADRRGRHGCGCVHFFDAFQRA